MNRLFENQIVRLGLAMVIGLLLGLLFFYRGGEQEHVHAEEVDPNAIWTCSMHPQIRQNEPGLCPICAMDLIPVSSPSSSASQKSPFVYEMSPEAMALANVQVSTVGHKILSNEVHLTGKVAVNEQKTAVITANYSGRIERLFVDFTGQTVKKGQKLASIYSPELVVAQKELLIAAKNKANNQVLYLAAREKLRLWKISDQQLDAIETSGEIQTAFDVYADLSGVVLRRNISMGDYVNRGGVLFEIADLSRLWILMDAYENDLPWVRVGSKVHFTVASIPGRKFMSEVTFIDPVINLQTRTASVRAEMANRDLALKPDMFVDAHITATKSGTDRVLLVPKTALLWTGKRSVVYVKKTDVDAPTFEMREVELGPRSGDYYVVLDGVQMGEQVVTHGAFAVDAASQLSGNYSMMSRPANTDGDGREGLTTPPPKMPMGHQH